MDKLSGKKTAVTDIAYREVTSQEKVVTDASSYTRIGWLIVIFGFGGFLLWATTAPLDEGVPVNGTVMVASSSKAIQHPTGGVVDEILVKEGDTVKTGQALLKMNAIQAKAQAEIAHIQYFSARATEARLIAERDGKKTIAFPPELALEKDNPQVAADILTQKQLFDSRRLAISSELAILREQLTGMRELAKEGYLPRNRLLDLERTYVQRSQGYQSEVRSQLADIEKEANALKMRLTSLDFNLANAIVKSPTDGTVVSINVTTKGAVVTPGFVLMEIVPNDDHLIVEGKVAINLIDKVHPGLEVDLIFSAFNQNKTPHIPGVVTFVSADRLVDQRNGAPYYKMKVAVTSKGMKMLKHQHVLPGMPVNLFIKTGERTMMNYLMKPLLDRAKLSLSED